MNEERNEVLFDLLIKKALHGLDETEQKRLDELDPALADRELRSLEMSAAAINIAGVEPDEPLPPHLYSKIAGDADKYIGAGATAATEPWPPARPAILADKPSTSFFGWLGWATAVAACIALAVNLWLTRVQAPEQTNLPAPVETPRPLTPAEQRTSFENSTPDLVKAAWAPGNVKEIKGVTGDVIWSDEKQAGYLRLRGLPVNDAAATCYQLWIFDKVQDKATPIDGGIFDVSSDGEIVIPINAKIKANGPVMFALTIERHGGVVVSKRDKIAALAKVETQSS
jgi:hypothetical protein